MTRDYHADQAARAETLYGWRRSKAMVCPRVVAGRRCLAYSGSGACLCALFGSLLDHGRIWLDAEGRHVLTGEPYHLDAGSLAAATAKAEEFGLCVTTKAPADSLWNPGYTHLIVVTNPAAPGRARSPRKSASLDGPTWADLEDLIGRRWSGRRTSRSGRTRGYAVPSPTGGTFSVEITLKPRFCSLAVDRWRTTDRETDKSTAWFEEHVWPVVKDAYPKCGRGFGSLPSGGGAYASAHPVERSELLDIMTAWVDAELTWGLPRVGDADE